MSTHADKIREALEAHLRSIRAVWSKADQGLRDDLEKLRGETFAILSELEAQTSEPRLTVDQIMEVVRKADKEWHDYYEEEFWSDLKDRLFTKAAQ